jgi:hypothetical protein
VALVSAEKDDDDDKVEVEARRNKGVDEEVAMVYSRLDYDSVPLNPMLDCVHCVSIPDLDDIVSHNDECREKEEEAVGVVVVDIGRIAETVNKVGIDRLVADGDAEVSVLKAGIMADSGNAPLTGTS